jgi:hypothetical protein
MKVLLLRDALRPNVSRWLAETAVSGDVCVSFDKLGAPQAAQLGIEAYFVDELLDWSARLRLEREIADLSARVTSALNEAGSTAEPGLGDVAAYDLRIALTEALRAAECVDSVLRGRTVSAVVAQPECPAGAVWGAAAAAPGATVYWSPAPCQPTPATASVAIANRLLKAASCLAGSRSIRVLAFPGGKVGSALQALTSHQLRSAGVGVATFPELVGGEAARLALAKRIPAAVVDERPRKTTPLPELDLAAISSTLGDRLTDVVASVLPRVSAVADRAAAATASLDAYRACHAILIPSTSGAAAVVLRAWARQREIDCAVIQHGIYVFRDWDRGDRDADALLAWGPAVADQFAPANGAPAIRVIGTPGLPQGARRDERPPRRVLIATTNAPTASALGLHGFCEDFLDIVAPFAAAWQDAGLDVRLRLHPSERPERSTYVLGRHGIELEPAQDGSFADVAPTFDAVVSSLSSVGFEAASLGLSVALWLGGWTPAVRAQMVLPPLDGDLPGTFATAEEFTPMADALATGSGPGLESMRTLTRRLASYAEPFDPLRAGEELQRLAG